MTIEQTDTIDFITVDGGSGGVWLTISDHLPWGEGKHLVLLQDKLNAYLRFIESGELLQNAPEAVGRPVVINLVCKFEPDAQGKALLDKASGAIRKAGFDLCFEVKRLN